MVFKNTNHLEILNLRNLYTNRYTIPLFLKGRTKDLESDDLYKPLKEHRSDNLGNKLSKSWEHELQVSAKKNKNPSLLRASLNVFGWEIVLQGFVLLILEFGCRCIQPIFLGGL
uniref:Uncharacterized protein n=1 Tax=Megaselia scalaris TaxID=36166 RepID=T1GTT2_MEGSC